jgi:hypothetical protein
MKFDDKKEKEIVRHRKHTKVKQGRGFVRR